MMTSAEVVPGMADAIERRRRERGLSPSDFAREAGVTLAGLAPLRSGKRRNYMHRLKVGVAHALWWPEDAVDRLLDGEDPKTFEEVRPESADDVAASFERFARELKELREDLRRWMQQPDGDQQSQTPVQRNRKK
jgi:transcriptional regulator with XRE-family HTH domain